MGTTDELKANTQIAEKVILEIHELDLEAIQKIKDLKNVADVRYNAPNLVVTYKTGKNNLVEMIDYLKTSPLHYTTIYSQRPTLNDVFLELTGKELRD